MRMQSFVALLCSQTPHLIYVIHCHGNWRVGDKMGGEWGCGREQKGRECQSEEKSKE